MSTKEDIYLYYDKERNPNGDRGLTYTCNCGWIDAGHARPINTAGLWQQLVNEKEKYKQNRIEGFKVNASENGQKWGMTIQEHSQDFFVVSGLSEAEKQRVALSIFQEVSHGFETLQNTGLTGGLVELWSKSSYSEEDLVSNLVGFYRAVRGETYDWRTLCKPVSEKASIDIWDKYGAMGDNINKFFIPNLHPCGECVGTQTFPYSYTTIIGMAKGIWHFDFDETGARRLYDGSRNPFLFDRGFNRNPFGLGFLEIPKQVKLQVNQGESQYLFCRRALIQAGFVAGLYSFEQWEYADKFYPLGQSFEKMSSFQMNWVSGDPSSDGSKT